MTRQHGTTAKRAFALSLCTTASLLSLGCITTGAYPVEAESPQTTTDIARFELSQDEVVVRGWLRDPQGQRCDRLVVRPNQSFDAVGTNCHEKWTLKELRKDLATFDVRGRYYGCTDLFAIVFGIPSRTSHWTVSVRRSDPTTSTSSPPDWFR
ncbi:MAG: hypothetical protein JXQ73_34095 [Phycisphaerae bacterium]|nr:hypothetical protein [Phycisphaerae bacterium]